MSKSYKLEKYGDTYEIQLRKSEYMNNGTLALIMVYYDEEYEEWEVWSDLTVNIDDSEIMASETKAFVDTNNNGNDIIPWLEENGLGHSTGLVGFSGWCTYPLFEFDKEALKEIEEY